jgi:hypothetical protein
MLIFMNKKKMNGIVKVISIVPPATPPTAAIIAPSASDLAY